MESHHDQDDTSTPSYTSVTMLENSEIVVDQPLEAEKTTNNEETKTKKYNTKKQLAPCRRLHGRAKEQGLLLDIHQSNLTSTTSATSQVILIRGPPGCGKTELVRRTLQHQPMARSSSAGTRHRPHHESGDVTPKKNRSSSNGAHPCRGVHHTAPGVHHDNLVLGHLMIWKSDPQTMLQIGPGISHAIGVLINDLLAREHEWPGIQKHLWTTYKLDATQIATLLKFYPQLEPLLVNPELISSLHQSQKQMQKSGDSASSTHARPEYLLDWSAYKAFLRVLSSVDFPMTFMYDDFQWIEPNSLEWVTTQMGDSKVEAGLFIATLNDKDDTSTSAGHNLWGEQIDKWKQQENVVLTEIDLDNLDEASAHEMVSEMLMMSADKNDDTVKEISCWIYQQTEGNPRYIEELMLGLYEEGLLRYDDGIDTWVLVQPCAVSMLPNEDDIATSASPVSMYLAHAKLSKLREGLKEVLKVAACLGYRFETKLVAAALSKSSSTASTLTTNDYLEMARDAGIIVNGGGSFYSKGACRFVHNSMHKAALSLVGKDRAYFHLKMARSLLRNLSDEEVEADLLNISGQVIFGASAIKRKEEKYQCAQITLRAAQTCVRLSSFKSAQKSVSFAIDMLDIDHTNAAWRDEYDLTLALFNAAAEVAYANGDFEIVEARVDSVLKHARSFEDKLQANSTKLYMLGSMDRVDEAIELGFALLRELGEPFPKVANKGSILRSLYRTKMLLNGKSDGALLRSPVMTDSRVTSAMQIMNILFSSVFVGKPMVAPLLAMRMVQLSLTHGFCAISCFAFSVYGMLLCSQGANVEEGTRFGDLSLRLLDRFQAKEFIPRVYAAVHGFIYGWSRPYKESFEPLMRGYRVGLQTGDMEFAIMNASLYILYSFDCGKPLSLVAQDRATYIEQVSNRHKDARSLTFSPLFYTIDRLMGLDSIYSLESNVKSVQWADYERVALAFIEGDYGKAASIAQQCDKVPYEGFDLAVHHMCSGLANIAYFRESGKRGLVAAARQYLKILDRTSKQAADNCLSKFLLLEAEVSSLSPRKHKDTVRKYLCAIGLADSAKSLFEGALAHELYGRYLERCRTKATATVSSLAHLEKSCSLFREWDAKPKADMLQREIDNKTACETKS